MRLGRLFAPATKGRRRARLSPLAALAFLITAMAAPLPALADMPAEVLHAFGLRPPDRNAGRETAALQMDLLWIGHYSGATDGIPNQDLRQAIRNFQESLGLRSTGELTPEQREILRKRAAVTSAGQKIETETSDWTGIRMALPKGFLGPPRVVGDESMDLSFPSRAAVTFTLQQLRWGDAISPRQITGFFAETYAENDPGTAILSHGLAGDVGYLMVETLGQRIYMVVSAWRGESRGILIVIPAESHAALQPVVLTMLESLDLFAGAGVSKSEREARLRSGDYPGMDDQPGWFRSMLGNGSGSLVSTEGHILTNHHVVGTCKSLTVNGRPARLIGVDVRTDLALIQSDHFANREPVSFRSGMPALGEKVIAIGYPVFRMTHAQNVTDGIISSLFGMEGNLLQMQVTAPVQPGNSGGPLLDSYGRQVAVVVSKATGNEMIENVAWVIRGEVAMDFLDRYGIRYIRDRGTREAMTTEEVAAKHRAQALRIECH
ncbi:trypsin-like peptidase domain-containing protein [Pseudogemmobacter bohemicus]|uniref:trypsin-like peptidase domain-containing protein n=1 Tax=Pseudogemmobacter bohemicus TaxID=2250708 RepID=UPI000DD2EB80|nr:serine protease [Pseudogemmobacter bohemicus]